jgi:acylphosphatase
MMSEQRATRLHAVVHGHVHGVFYRATTRREATALGLTGWVRNCPDGTVELVAEGTRAACESLLDFCRGGPPAARVTAIDPEWSTSTGGYDGFTVRYD